MVLATSKSIINIEEPKDQINYHETVQEVDDMSFNNPNFRSELEDFLSKFECLQNNDLQMYNIQENNSSRHFNSEANPLDCISNYNDCSTFSNNPTTDVLRPIYYEGNDPKFFYYEQSSFVENPSSTKRRCLEYNQEHLQYCDPNLFTNIQDNPISLSYPNINGEHSIATSNMNKPSAILTDQMKDGFEPVENNDVNSRFRRNRKRNHNEEALLYRTSDSKDGIKFIYVKLINEKIDDIVGQDKLSSYRDYTDYENSSFILVHFENLLQSCFACCDFIDINEFRLLITDIFIYYRFSAIKNSVIGKLRVINFLIEIYEAIGITKNLEEVTKFIFKDKKKLKRCNPRNRKKYPNFVSHRNYKLSNRQNSKFRNKMIEYLPELRNGIELKLNILVKKYLEHKCILLSEKDKIIIKRELEKSFSCYPFESIIEMGVYGINLIEDRPIEKFYNNLFNNQNNEPFYFKGSLHAIEIQMFIRFVKACIFKNGNQLTCLEYITLLNYMGKSYLKYNTSNVKGTMEEQFYDSMCFFVQSFAYDQSVEQGKIKYTFSCLLPKYLKGFRILKQLLPGWEEFISEEDFSYLP